MSLSYTRVVGPAQEPLALAEAKLQAHIDVDDENLLVSQYIVAAREAAEQYMGRGLLTQTWKVVVRDWAETPWLPMAAPLQSVTAIDYTAPDGTPATLSPSSLIIDETSEPARAWLAPAQVWPARQSGSAGVAITYVVGWPTVAAIPELIRQGCRLHVSASHLDRHGSAEARAARDAAQSCWALAGRVWLRPPVYAS